MEANSDVRVVPLDAGVFEVHLGTGADQLRIGKVVTDGQDTWMWQHRDGERSSPVASTLADVVHALAHYHRTFKSQPTPASMRRVRFG